MGYGGDWPCWVGRSTGEILGPVLTGLGGSEAHSEAPQSEKTEQSCLHSPNAPASCSWEGAETSPGPPWGMGLESASELSKTQGFLFFGRPLETGRGAVCLGLPRVKSFLADTNNFSGYSLGLRNICVFELFNPELWSPESSAGARAQLPGPAWVSRDMAQSPLGETTEKWSPELSEGQNGLSLSPQLGPEHLMNIISFNSFQSPVKSNVPGAICLRCVLALPRANPIFPSHPKRSSTM
jgi:hypothetical protein